MDSCAQLNTDTDSSEDATTQTDEDNSASDDLDNGGVHLEDTSSSGSKFPVPEEDLIHLVEKRDSKEGKLNNARKKWYAYVYVYVHLIYI